MKITIKNFQSIEDATLEVAEGAFTCLVGQTNIGKSAIRRAIECILYNKSDASYIRTGTKSCSVEILFDNKTHLKWQRDEKSASYEINGESFSKLSKTIPQPILDMGFRELEVNKEKLNVQVASQFDNIFLLNMTGSKVTDVFSNLGNLNKIINANKACSSDLKSSKSRLSLRREDLLTVKSKIKNYSGLDEQRNVLDSLKDSFEELKSLKKRKESVELLSKRFDSSSKVYKALSPVKQVTISDLDIDISKLSQIQKLLVKLNSSQGKVSAGSDLSYISEVSYPDISIDTLSKIKSLREKYSKAYCKNEHFQELSEVSLPSFEDDVSSKIKPLKELSLKLEKSKLALLKIREELKVVEEKSSLLDSQEKELHKEFKICPLCNSEFKDV